MKKSKMIGFICPLKEESSETRKRSDDIMYNILVPIAAEFGYTIERADQKSGYDVMRDIIDMIRSADIIIADLTEMNPNVFYELGLRQATKGKCINIICEEEKREIPFDIEHYRAYKYKRAGGDYNDIRKFESFIRESIRSLESSPFQSVMPMSTEELVDIYGVTIVSEFLKGAKNHYALSSNNLINGPCKKIFLMQRSSSLVLNAEQGWGEEAEFIKNIKTAINECGYFYHIISLDGIRAHFHRKNSVFPNFEHFSENLRNVNGNAAFKNDNQNDKNIFYLRKLPVDNQDTLFKLDRQARVLITERQDGMVKAVIVQNLGDNQTCFLIEGEKAKDYLDSCIEFYNSCEYVEWRELKKLYEEYKEVEKSREQV